MTIKKFVLATMVLPLAIACNQEAVKENERLKTENEDLRGENEAKDSLINAFVSDFASIQENLASIRDREESIRAAREGGSENAESVREGVIRDVNAINDLLAENKSTIADLNAKLGRYGAEVGKFKRMVANLSERIEEKDAEVGELKSDLQAANFEVSRLNARLDTAMATTADQKERIKEQMDALNTGYYAIGSYKDLEANQVVDKEGGFIGIGRTKTLADDFNRDYFTKVDITKTKMIPLDTDDDVKLVTNHPSDSYKIIKKEKVNERLEITNAERFWKSSKYLVIVVD